MLYQPVFANTPVHVLGWGVIRSCSRKARSACTHERTENNKQAHQAQQQQQPEMMSTRLWAALNIVAAVSVVCAMAATPAETSVLKIRTLNDFWQLLKEHKDKPVTQDVELLGDLDFTGHNNFTSVSLSNATWWGNNHTISNLTTDRPFFDTLSHNATVRDFVLDWSCDMVATKDQVSSSLIGRLEVGPNERVVLENTKSYVTMNSTAPTIGGLVGTLVAGTNSTVVFARCAFVGLIETAQADQGERVAAGFVGTLQMTTNATVAFGDCANYGTFKVNLTKGNAYMAGFVAKPKCVGEKCRITFVDSDNRGRVSAIGGVGSEAAGLVLNHDENINVTIAGGFNTHTVTSSGSAFGFANQASVVVGALSAWKVFGGHMACGVVGTADVVARTANLGEVSSNGTALGIAHTVGTIEACINRGNISAAVEASGFVHQAANATSLQNSGRVESALDAFVFARVATLLANSKNDGSAAAGLGGVSALVYEVANMTAVVHTGQCQHVAVTCGKMDNVFTTRSAELRKPVGQQIAKDRHGTWLTEDLKILDLVEHLNQLGEDHDAEMFWSTELRLGYAVKVFKNQDSKEPLFTVVVEPGQALGEAMNKSGHSKYVVGPYHMETIDTGVVIVYDEEVSRNVDVVLDDGFALRFEDVPEHVFITNDRSLKRAKMGVVKPFVNNKKYTLFMRGLEQSTLSTRGSSPDNGNMFHGLIESLINKIVIGIIRSKVHNMKVYQDANAVSQYVVNLLKPIPIIGSRARILDINWAIDKIIIVTVETRGDFMAVLRELKNEGINILKGDMTHPVPIFLAVVLIPIIAQQVTWHDNTKYTKNTKKH